MLELEPAIRQLLATTLASKIEVASYLAVMTPTEWPHREAAIRNIDELRELMRQLFPDAVDQTSTRILPETKTPE
jgi:hypothetical protein